MSKLTLLDGARSIELEARFEGGRVQLAPEAVQQGLGFALKPEGLCRGPLCIPVRDRGALVGPAGIDLLELARVLGRPLALDVEERAAALGTPVEERRTALAGLEAPDFTLPDLSGRLHTLSAHRGKKVLLIAYASW